MKYTPIALLALVSALAGLSYGSRGSERDKIDRSHLIAINYMQTAAEVRALYHQAFNVARARLDADLALGERDKPRAIVVDVDETLVVTIPYNATNMQRLRDYPEGWDAWIKLEEAKPIPGALELLRYADQRGVEIFYITNRRARLRAATLGSLRGLGYPIEDARLLMKTDSSDKEPRRLEALARHHVVFYIGDNLIDFPGRFDKAFTRTLEGRAARVEAQRARFGVEWIVLPNAVYGDWENALYDYDFQKDAAQKIADRERALRLGR